MPAEDNGVRLVRLREEDLPFALRLTRENGWNQCVADWRRWMALSPTDCRMALWRGRRAGTIVGCPFGPIAWLAMVMVARQMRGRGIGGALLREGLRRAERRGCSTIRLDATPLGRSLYDREGFAPQFEVRRWAGSPILDLPPMDHAGWVLQRESRIAGLSEICAMDGAATRTPRARFLRRLAAESAPWTARAPSGELAGFLFHRRGRIATQIGPACGESAAVAHLLRCALHRFRGRPVFVDIPEGNREMETLASAAGLTVARTFLRMCRGRWVLEDPDRFHLSSGPELG